MSKPLNTIQKKLKFHCSVCSTTWQLLVIRTDNLTNKDTKCLNNCPQKWESLLITYCQERQIIYFANKEQQKEQDLATWLEQIRKQNKK